MLSAGNMNDFVTKDKTYILQEGLRDRVKPNWQEMLNPAKQRVIKINLDEFSPSVFMAERNLYKFNESLVDRKILEVGCNEGARSFLMAKYQDTYVHGIDVDEYTVDQSPDLNVWNPNDIKFVHDKFDERRLEVSKQFPMNVVNKVTFETTNIETYKVYELYDVVASWDTIEHIIDLPTAFKNMADCLIKDGISYHEYNPFFAFNGGHSLCTLDFLYGHCILSKDDFERYVKEIRPEEEKIDINFYNKCLNRASIADVRKYAEDAGFEVLQLSGTPSFGRSTIDWKDNIGQNVLPQVIKNYPTVIIDDLLCDNVILILRKK